MLALVRETLVVKRLEDDLDLLLEQLAIGVLIEHRRAEGLHLARVIAAPDAENGAALGHDVGASEVLGQPQRVPHRRDIESAANPEALRQMAEMHRRHQQIRDDLVAFLLEVVLGHPQRVPAALVHHPGDRLAFVEHAGEMRVGEASLVRGCRVLATIRQIDVAGIDGRKLLDHDSNPPRHSAQLERPWIAHRPSLSVTMYSDR